VSALASRTKLLDASQLDQVEARLAVVHQRLTQIGERKDAVEQAAKLNKVAELLACWTQAQKARVQFAAAPLSGNSLRQTVHTRRASVHQAAKLVAALLRVAGVTAGLAESNGSLPPGL